MPTKSEAQDTSMRRGFLAFAVLALIACAFASYPQTYRPPPPPPQGSTVDYNARASADDASHLPIAEGRDGALPVKVAVIEERLRLLDKAMELQAREYGRRLDELNHANAKQVADQATYVGREAFETFVTDVREWREGVDQKLTLLEGRSAGTGTTWGIFFQVLPLLIAAIALFVSIRKPQPAKTAHP